MTLVTLPEGYHSVTPYLFVREADNFIDFLMQAFGGKERMRIKSPNGSIGHAEVEIGDSVVMIAEASDKWIPSPGHIHLYVENVNATHAVALKAGATSMMEPSDQAHGDRMGSVKDPFDNIWWIATRKEKVSPAETEKRWKARRNQSD